MKAVLLIMVCLVVLNVRATIMGLNAQTFDFTNPAVTITNATWSDTNLRLHAFSLGFWGKTAEEPPKNSELPANRILACPSRIVNLSPCIAANSPLSANAFFDEC